MYNISTFLERGIDMKELFFNTYEFNYAKDLMFTNPIESKVRFQAYLSKYPKDYLAYTYYASVLIMLRELDLANEVVLEVLSEVSNDKAFLNVKNRDKLDLFRQNVTFAKAKILFNQGKYQELYDEYFKNDISYETDDDINSFVSFNMGFFNYNATNFYCKKKLGLLPQDLKTHTYLFNQILDYSEADFLKHIEKHTINNDSLTNNSTSLFMSDFNIKEVINEIKKYIPSEYGLFSGMLQDMYIFKYDNCGRDNNRVVDYFKVICFHDTCEFITMCPSMDCEYLPSIDLNYMNASKINDNVKIKRRSGIDRFNQRFGKN